LEARLKRRRAVQELRALAHLLDMFQLTKSPERVGHLSEPIEVAGRALTVKDMSFYLVYGTELLALLSKVGHIYAREFPEPAAKAAVDGFEGLAVGLTNEIWQKNAVLGHIQSEVEGKSKPSRKGSAQANARD
jgi:hypothetical protein